MHLSLVHLEPVVEKKRERNENDLDPLWVTWRERKRDYGEYWCNYIGLKGKADNRLGKQWISTASSYFLWERGSVGEFSAGTWQLCSVSLQTVTVQTGVKGQGMKTQTAGIKVRECWWVPQNSCCPNMLTLDMPFSWMVKQTGPRERRPCSGSPKLKTF